MLNLISSYSRRYLCNSTSKIAFFEKEYTTVTEVEIYTNYIRVLFLSISTLSCLVIGYINIFWMQCADVLHLEVTVTQ